ncbi:MAG TPA: hypothetical protein VFF65_04225 [Phycisphaerales bacterium]|nr:hypothetical protein [Phycisphaerales bacterium]
MEQQDDPQARQRAAEQLQDGDWTHERVDEVAQLKAQIEQLEARLDARLEALEKRVADLDDPVRH